MLGLQVKILIAVLFQFYGVIFLLLLFRKFKYDQLLAYYALKRSVARRRARYIKMRRLARKKRSKWVESGRSDAWWQNMVNGLSADHEWKRNFRMSKEMFGELCEKLRPYISPKETPNFRFLSVEKKCVCKILFLNRNLIAIHSNYSQFLDNLMQKKCAFFIK